MHNKSDFYGHNFVPFVGVVEDVIDEAYVKVRVFGIHPFDKMKVRTDQLPSALVAYPTTGGQVSSGSISHNLEIDAWVMGYFVDAPFYMQPIITNVVQGTTYSMSNGSSGGGEFVGQGNVNIDITATTNIPGGSNIEKTYNFVVAKLKAEGFTGDHHIAASAVAGVLMLETTGINPAIVGGYKGRAWGICQWLGTRREQLFSKFGQTKRLDQQLDFMWWELNNTERRAKGLWLRATNLPDAVDGFCNFERAEEMRNGRVDRTHSNYKKRLAFAYQVYNTIKPSATITTPSTVGSGTMV